MGRNTGPSVAVSFNTEEARREVQKLTDELKQSVKAFEAQNIALQASGDNLGVLQGKLKQYADQANRQRDITAKCREALEQESQALKQKGSALDAAKAKLESEARAENQSAESIKKLKDELKKAQTAYGSAQKKVDSWKNKLLNSEKAEAQLKLSVKEANDAIKKQATLFTEAGKKADSMAGQMKSAFNMLRAVALGYAGKTLFSALIGSNAQFEQYMTAFDVMLGGADKAKAMMEDLEDFAAKTPLQLPDATKAAQLLLNYGVAEDQVIEKMTQLGDLSLGQAEKLDRISLAYGQMLAKGKVTGEELRQMNEAGVPLTQALADTMGVTTGELYKLIETGKVGIPELDKAIESLTTGTGKFAGMMERQSQTMMGMWSTLKDEAAKFGREVGDESFNYLKGELNDLMATLRQMEQDGSLQDLAGEIGSSVAGAIKFIADLIKWLWDMREALLVVGGALVGFKAGMAIGRTISTVITGIQGMIKTYQALRVALTAAKASNEAMKISMATTPWGAIIAVIGLAVGALATWALTTDSADDKLKKMNDSMEALKASTEDNLNSQRAELDIVEREYDKLEALSQKTEKTTDDKIAMRQAIEDINRVLPDSITIIDNETMAYKMQKGSVDDLIAAKRALLQVKAKEDVALEAQKNINAIDKELDAKKLEFEKSGLPQGPPDTSHLILPKKLGDKASGLPQNPFDPSLRLPQRLSPTDQLRYQAMMAEEDKLLEAKKENQAIIDDWEKEIEEYNKKFGKTTQADSQSAPYTPSGSAKSGETFAQQYLRQIRYMHDRGLMSDKEYMRELIATRDKYYQEGTAEWQSLDLEAHRLRMQLLDEETKAREDSIKNSVQSTLDAEKEWYTSLIDKVNEYYDQIDKREEQRKRKQSMDKLRVEEEKYKNAVTAAGKDKLGEIQEKIDQLNEQDAKDLRLTEKEKKLRALDATWNKYEDSQQQVLKNIGKFAEITSATIEEVNRRVSVLAAQTRDYLLSIARGNANSQIYNQQQSFQQSNTFQIYDYASKSIMDSYVLDMPNRFPGR